MREAAAAILAPFLLFSASRVDSTGCGCGFRSSAFSVSELGRGERMPLLGGVVSVPWDYNKNLQPPGEPMLVDIGFIVNDILEVDDELFTIKMKMEMPLYWNDSRMALNLTVMDERSPGR